MLPVNTPKQDRSRRTMERHFEAGYRLFAENAIDAVTVPQIAAAAESSVGAFYKRFADKDAFVAAFYDRFFEKIRLIAREQLAGENWDGKSARAVIRGLILSRLEHYRQHRSLLANLFNHLRLHGDERFVQHALAFGDELTVTLTSLLATPRADMPRSPGPGRVRLIIGISSAALRERILYGRARGRSHTTDLEYAETIARMAWLELTHGDSEIVT